MAEEDDEKEDAGRPRKSCTLTPVTIRYLEKLVDAGTHGPNVSAVMSRLIEEGVRQAIRDGFISKREP